MACTSGAAGGGEFGTVDCWADSSQPASARVETQTKPKNARFIHLPIACFREDSSATAPKLRQHGSASRGPEASAITHLQPRPFLYGMTQTMCTTTTTASMGAPNATARFQSNQQERHHIEQEYDDAPHRIGI
jgi:hypothetical protein